MMTPGRLAALTGGYGQSVTVKRSIANSPVDFVAYDCSASISGKPAGKSPEDITDGVILKHFDGIFAGADVPSGFPGAAGGNPWPDDGDLVVTASGEFRIIAPRPSFIGDQLFRVDCSLIKASGARYLNITLQQNTPSQDAAGGTIENWEDLAVVAASKLDQGGNEFLAAGQINAQMTTKFQIAWRDDVTPALRLVCESALYDIISVAEIGRKDGLDIIAVARK